MSGAIVLGFFSDSTQVRAIARQLRSEGFLRSGLVHKNRDGSVDNQDPFVARRAWNTALGGLGGGFLATISLAAAGQLQRLLVAPQTALAALLTGVALGALLAALGYRRARFGLERQLMRDHARWLVADETVVILQVPIETLARAVNVLREAAEAQPIVFFLLPRREGISAPQPAPGIALSLPEIEEHARRLAADHQLDSQARPSQELLAQLTGNWHWIHQASQDLALAGPMEQQASPTAEWILDNEYIVESNARDVERNLPARFYRELPALKNSSAAGRPRVSTLAQELVSHTDLRLEHEHLRAFLEAYQSIHPLTIGELWAFPQMLRVALIESIAHLATRALAELREREIADFWANRLMTTSRREPSQLFAMMAELTRVQAAPTPYFASQLIGHLYDEEDALAPVQSWLERAYHRPLAELTSRETTRQSRDQILIGNAFTSLRQLALVDWRQVFEDLSHVERTLRLDPLGVYSGMDFETRDRYRQAVEQLARGAGLSEVHLAGLVVEHASRAAAQPDSDRRLAHIGSYLIGDRRAEFAQAAGSRRPLRIRLLGWVYAHSARLYAAGAAGLTAAVLVVFAALGLAGLPSGQRFAIVLLALIPASQLALQAVDYLVTRLLPPRTLPKMSYQASGIPDEFRTLVIVPEMLVSPEQIRSMVEKLEVRSLANQDSNLLFGLFTDFADCDRAHDEEDDRLLQTAVENVQALNHRYPVGRFFLLHRQRRWSDSEQKYIGWERKRGKLEELNQLIDGTRPADAPQLVHVGEPERLANVRFVITLDGDTQLPSGTARRMIETLAHPLNLPRLDAQGRIASGSRTIIQPRVTPSLPSSIATPFTRLFTDAVGIDPYTKAVSDVSQDLFGEGSYHGKGIYDVRAFSRALSGRFPEGRLLSHDLIEGAHVGVGLASDIELLDEFPPDYLGYTSREHRWIRGDWQIADWVLPRIPLAGGGHGPNPLSGIGRWKILDNLRRSLVPVSIIGLLVASWLFAPRAALISGLLIALLLFLQPLMQPTTWLTTRRGWRSFSLAKIGHDLVRTIVEAALILNRAGLALDAILRVGYRRWISHRGLLEWTSAQAMKWSAPTRLRAFLLSMGLASLVSGAAAAAVLLLQPASLPLAAFWLLLWFISPLFGWLLSRRPEPRQKQTALSANDREFLRAIARRTWRYFSHFVGAETSWLPPDNFQVSHKEHLAMRTSPTNIGLWMLSNLAAHDFGYLTPDAVVTQLTQTMATIARLDRYEGHLLNWYDIQTLTPLEPRYVSAADSGNLLAGLWCLRQGLEELVSGPLLQPNAWEGLGDTWNVIEDESRDNPSVRLGSQEAAALRRALAAMPSAPLETIRALRTINAMVHGWLEPTAGAGEAGGTRLPWAVELARQTAAWVTLVDRYLTWMEILSEKDHDELATLGLEAFQAFQQDLQRAPSLRALAAGEVPSLAVLRSLRQEGSPAIEPMAEWLDRLIQSFDRSKWLAGERLAQAEQLIQDTDRLADSINMYSLYDPARRLFAIGYNVSTGRLDGAYYDLLASEARLGSFAAIAEGSVPIEHWFAMSRPYNLIGRSRVLLSWTGTMFEYLMPLLLQRSVPNSLLDRAVRDAVRVQIAYGRRRRVPWGISECAYGDLDAARTYQYKAFGVPDLGLKRDLARELVIAPYATLLALSVAPRETVVNLRRLADLHLLNDFGFFEAVDFTRRPERKGELGVTVRAFMAHHQGMGLLALANALHGEPFPRRFHAEPRVRAVESLLHERVPTLPPLHLVSTRERIPTVKSIAEAEPSVSKFDTPHTPTPKTQLLSNGRYSLMVSNAGGGYSQWGDIELTRWRSDRTRDSWGTFCYLHDAEAGRLWSNTYQPVGGKIEGYHAHFALDQATFRRVDGGIHTETEIVVSPEDDVEIRRLTLVNRTLRTHHVDLTSYIELSLAPHNTDLAHPAFNKLFVQTEAVPDPGCLLAFRRPRAEDEPAVFVGHRLTADPRLEAEGLRFETDRRPFIGRGRSLAAPMGAEYEPGDTQGYVLDPILSLRRTIILPPGERRQVSLVLAAGGSREAVLQLMVKYGDPQAIERAMDVAWASAQLELRLLRIQPDDARRFQKLASHLLYPGPTFRASAERFEERNRKGQAGLWAYGISGDLPIVLITIGDVHDIPLVRQMLQAHAYWRSQGLKADLVILNEEAGGYDQPLHERLDTLIRVHAPEAEVDQPGGVYLRSADQIPEEDQRLLMAAARVVLVAARGSLAQQLGVPAELPEPPSPLTGRPAPREPSAPLPFMELPYFNSLGGFTRDGREYVIYLGPNTHTPAPWVNVIANPDFGAIVSETGAGYTWSGNSQRNRLTPWSNDPVLDPASEAIYIRDEESGEFWTPTASPIRQSTAYRARHGAGYTVYEHNSHAIEQELTVLVPVEGGGGPPIKLQRLRMKNDSSRPRRLSVTTYAEWALGESREATEMHVVSTWDDEAQVLLARNRYHPEYGDRVAFAAINRPVDSFSADRTSFLGRNRTLANPAALERVALSGRTGAGLDPCAALRTAFELAPGETAEVVCLLGQAESSDQAQALVKAFAESTAFEIAFDRTKAWWDETLGAVEVHTPELSVDFLVNRWLLYQVLSCRVWGRTGVYQSGGAFGFRDQLQDVLALLHARPEVAREHILLAASRQFREGDVQHWWHPPSGAGTRTRISDDLLWLPYAVAQYVRHTGDLSILGEQVPFLDAPLLTDEQHDAYLTPQAGGERVSVLEHCQRAVRRGLTRGPHGLPLIGTGDWNDGMDQVGAQGRGESVWLAWFLVDVLDGMADLSGRTGVPEAAEAYRMERLALIDRIEASAWDGAWYLRARFDDGTPVGSAASEEAKIDLLPQAWATLSGGGDPGRAAMALESAVERLVRPDERLVLLFDPPFDRTTPSPGYIRGYPPGVRENGGQYTHAAVWLAAALARRGQGTRAADVLRMLNPIERAREVDSVWRYTVEPYVISADVYRAPGRVGQGGWSWYTGSAAWMYRAWVEELLGLHVCGDSLRLDPVIPGWWSGFRLTYRRGEALYEIQVDNSARVERGVASVEMDGQPLTDGVIPLERELVKHRVVVRMGHGSAGPSASSPST